MYLTRNIFCFHLFPCYAFQNSNLGCWGKQLRKHIIWIRVRIDDFSEMKTRVCFYELFPFHTSNPNLGSVRALSLGERGLRPGVGLTQTAGFRQTVSSVARGAAQGLRKAVGPGSSSVEGQ